MRRPDWIVLFALAGCVGPDDVDDANDRDRDGYTAFQAGGDDCDDGDAAVNPGADEVCGNTVDDDCDGFVDDDGVGGGTFYPDSDGDGFGDGNAPVEACAAPADHLAVGGDCNDGSNAIHPDAVEVWYDGVDQDCAGDDDFDQDGDGHTSEEEAVDGTDCDDLAEAVHPGAIEVCGNLADDDCDGDHDGCDWSGGGAVRDWIITTGTTTTPFVSSGDLGADGANDIALWLPDENEVYFYWGGVPDQVDLTLLHGTPVLSMPTVQAGHSLAVTIEQDLTGDGRADLVVGTWKPGTAGEVRMFAPFEALWPNFDQSASVRLWTGPTASASAPSDGFGSSLVAMGVVPGSTFGTLVFPYRGGTPAYDCLVHHDAPTSGSADLIASLIVDSCEGAIPGALDTTGDTFVLGQVGLDLHMIDSGSPTDVDASTQPEANLLPALVLADVLRVVGDVNGDGYSEVTAIDTNGTAPAVRMIYGPVSTSTPTKVFRLVADPAHIQAFLDLDAADVNGDGLLDILVLMDTVQTGDPGATAVGVLFGPLQWDQRFDVTPDLFDAVLDLPAGERANTLVPSDIDGDGYTDVVLPGPGKVRVLYGSGR